MNIAQHLLIRMIGAYRWLVSPVLTALFSPGGMCRYSPSCSEYAQQAIQSHGVVAGAWLAARRVWRCHPWGGCGHDPVPEESSLKLHLPLDRGLRNRSHAGASSTVVPPRG